MMIAQYGWIERKKNLMVVYGYSCENNNCQHKFEIEQHMTDDALVECPCCKCSTLIRIIYAPMVFSKGEPTTIGHQADRNTQKLGHYEYEDKNARTQKPYS
jgi:putative FmdB family regulatory protein